MGLERMMNLDRRGEEAFHDRGGVGKRLIDVPLLLDVRVGEIGRVRPYTRRVGILRDLLLHDERQGRGFDHDGAQSVETCLLRYTRDRSQFLAVETNGPFAFALDTAALMPGT